SLMSPLLLLTLWIAGLQIRQPPPSRATIQGVVIRVGAAAGAQQHLADAKLELKPGNVTVTSGTDGAFTFRNLVPGRYTITVTRAGYIPQVDPSHGITAAGLNITVVAGQNLKDISLPMIPSPVITGTVFGPHGGPLAAGLVQAYMRQYTPI